ncbi:MAG: diguanylate cyclase domain-containing protein [Solirubrobacteraceae bacterium]
MTARLSADREEIAKRWLLGLVMARGLQETGEMPFERFAHEAPTLCDEVLRALSSEEVLEWLAAGAGVATGASGARAGQDVSQAGEAPDVAAMTGAGEGPGVIAAVEALRGALWECLLEALPDLSGGEVAALSDRLAHVCACVAQGALATGRRDSEPGQAPDAQGRSWAAQPAPSWPSQPEPQAGRTQAPEAEGTEGEPGWEGMRGEPAGTGPGGPAFPRIERRERELTERRGPEASDWEVAGERRAPGEASDVDAALWPGGSASWIDSVATDLERTPPRAPRRLAVLLIEMAELERLRRVEGTRELGGLVGEVAGVLGRHLRTVDRLAEEGAGRWWLVVPEEDSAGARLLAERLAGAVRATVEHRGLPVELVVGVASSQEAGDDPEGLANRAEQELYAARAAGISVTPGR